MSHWSILMVEPYITVLMGINTFKFSHHAKFLHFGNYFVTSKYFFMAPFWILIVVPTIANMWDLVGDQFGGWSFSCSCWWRDSTGLEQSPRRCRQNGHQMAQFEGCVGKIIWPLSSLTYCQIFQSPGFLEGIERPSMVPTEAPGSLLSNKLLLIENGQNGHQMAQFEGCVGKVMNEPSPVGVIAIFFVCSLLEGDWQAVNGSNRSAWLSSLQQATFDRKRSKWALNGSIWRLCWENIGHWS